MNEASLVKPLTQTREGKEGRGTRENRGRGEKKGEKGGKDQREEGRKERDWRLLTWQLPEASLVKTR